MAKVYDIEVLYAIANKATDLKEGCYKHRLEVLRPKFEAARPGESFTDNHRDPATIQGLLSPSAVQALLDQNDSRQALLQCGLTIVTNDEVMFLTDDSTYADKVLGSSFMGVTFGRPDNLFGEGKRYPTVDAFVKAHQGDTTLCRTVTELATYLITGDVPENKQPEKLFVTKVGMTTKELLDVFLHSVAIVCETPTNKIHPDLLENFNKWKASLKEMLKHYQEFVKAAFPENIANAAFAMGAAEDPKTELLTYIADGDFTKYPVFFESVWASVRNSQ